MFMIYSRWVSFRCSLVGHFSVLADSANLFLAVVDETDDHGLSMHVYATAAAVNDVH